MAMGRRKTERQASLFITAEALAKSGGHPFYRQLNVLLKEAEFDRWVEDLCRPYYEEEERRGWPSLPPGVYFRMLLIGYFEGIDSQRGIAWRCADSLALREFLGIALHENTPEHSTLGYTRRRLPPEVFAEVFQFVLKLAAVKQLLSGKTVGVDSTTLEANAAMKSIIRRDTGEDWKEYVTRLMREDGVIEPDETPSDEDIRRFDKGRKDKKVSNEDWVSETDPSARIAKMKDGRTHLAYKAEHVVDLATNVIVAAEIYPADQGDAETLVDSVMMAQMHLEQVDTALQIEEVVADKGYHAAATLEHCDLLDLRTYIPERKSKHRARWTDKPADFQRCVLNNRKRIQRPKSKQLQRERSELCERSFAHVCDTGGSRRTWLRGVIEVTKRYLIAVAGHNLSQILRKLFGMGKPRRLQDGGRAAGLAALATTLISALVLIAERFRTRLPIRPAITPRRVVHLLQNNSVAYQTA
jgi:transposase